MARKNEMKARLVLEGEQKYNKALKDAANAVKTLNAEQKLAEAQFKATGDAEEYQAKKTEILRKQIAEQEKAVEAAEKAVKDLTELGVKPNSQQMQNWQRKLADAKTRLQNMQNELTDTEAGLDSQGRKFEETGRAAGEYREQIDEAAKGIDFQNTIAAIDNVRDHIAGVIKATARAAKAMWDWEVDAGKWADDLATAASQAGIDVETYQSWQYASRFIDTDVESIIRSQDKLVKGMQSSNKDVGEAFRMLGVSMYNSGLQPTMRDSIDVFWDVIDALREMGDTTEAEYIAQTLLGRSYRELKPLIDAGSEAYLAMAEEGREVGVVSAENVEALGAMDDAYQRLQATFEATKYDMLAKLAPTFTQVADAMAQAVEAFNAFMQTEEGQAALDNLNNAITDLIKGIVGENGEGLTSLATKAGNAVKTITDGLAWIIGHGEAVKNVLLGLGTAWTLLTVSKNVLMFLQLMKSIPWHSVGSAAGKIAGAAGGGSSAAGGGGALAKVGKAGKSVFGALGSFVGSAAPMVGAGLAGVALAAPGAYLLDRQYTEERYGEYNALLDKLPGIVAGAMGGEHGMEARLLDAIQTALEAYEAEGDIDPLRSVFEEYADKLAEMVEFDIGEALNNDQFRALDWADAGYDLVTELAKAIESRSTTAKETASTAGANVATSVANGIKANIWRVRNAMASMMSATSAAPVVSGGGLLSGAARGGRNTTAVIMMDKTVVGRMVAPSVDRTIGATVAAARRGG